MAKDSQKSVCYLGCYMLSIQVLVEFTLFGVNTISIIQVHR